MIPLVETDLPNLTLSRGAGDRQPVANSGAEGPTFLVVDIPLDIQFDVTSYSFVGQYGILWLSLSSAIVAAGDWQATGGELADASRPGAVAGGRRWRGNAVPVPPRRRGLRQSQEDWRERDWQVAVKTGMLAGKVVIVTGAASGIGKAAALLFADEGARVALFDIDGDAGAAVAETIRQQGGVADCWQVDVAREQQVAEAVAAVIAQHGQLDGAFNNAGIEMANKLVPDLGADAWQRMLDVNLSGVFHCMKHETRAMPAGGAIVNMASGDGIIGAPYAADYVAAKHGVVGLTRAAACEARYTGVRVNVLLPGLILTPMVEERLFANPEFEKQVAPMVERHSIGRFGQPAEVAEAACWLLCDRSSFINGALLTVDGGYTAR